MTVAPALQAQANSVASMPESDVWHLQTALPYAHGRLHFLLGRPNHGHLLPRGHNRDYYPFEIAAKSNEWRPKGEGHP